MRDNVARDFSTAAAIYEEHAELQRRTGSEMAGLLGALLGAHPAPRVLDAGCGPGALLAAMEKRRPHWQMLGADLAEGMCRTAQEKMERTRIIRADMTQLPLADESLDAILSNAALQWAEDPIRLLMEWRRVLKPGGLIAASTFGPATLQELRAAFESVDSWPHVQTFGTQKEWILLARAAELTPLQTERKVETRSYPSVNALMRHLKAIGARNKRADRRRGLFTPRLLSAVEAAYPMREKKHILASWEIVSFVFRRDA